MTSEKIAILSCRSFWIALLLCICCQVALCDVEEDLKKIKERIEADTPDDEKRNPPLLHYSPAQQFLEGQYRKYFYNQSISDLDHTLIPPIFIHNRVGRWAEVGNYLGIYFDAIACADLVGAHYIAVNSQYIRESWAQIDSEATARFDAFLQALPSIIPSNHASTKEFGELRKDIDKKCPCQLFCWQNPAAAWVQRTELIAQTFGTALKSYLGQYPRPNTLSLKGGIDVLKTPPSTTVTPPPDSISSSSSSSASIIPTSLPFVPDVIIQYRCSEIVHHDRYGFIPFSAFSPDRMPSNITTIYITTDHPNRAEEFQFSKGKSNKEYCTKILNALADHLRTNYPAASVAILRGDDLFNDITRFTQAKVLFCSASTFCLWPALASSATAVYIPVSSVILEAQEKHMRPHVQWLSKPAMLRFTKNEGIDEILNALKAGSD